MINSAEFSAQSSEINNKISTLRTKRRKKLSDDENDAWFDTLNSLNEILEAYDPSNNFDEELFEKIVVGITVNQARSRPATFKSSSVILNLQKKFHRKRRVAGENQNIPHGYQYKNGSIATWAKRNRNRQRLFLRNTPQRIITAEIAEI